MERFHRMLVKKIKTEVMAELERSRRYPESYHSGGYPAYCQLVDAVREEVLYDLKSRPDPYGGSDPERRRLAETIKHDVLRQLENRPEWSCRPYHSGGYGYSGGTGQSISPEEIRMIKDEVIRDWQSNPEEEAEQVPERQH